MTDPERNDDFEALLVYLKTTRGFDFTGYKRASLMRRVGRRTQDLGIPTFAEYLDHLEVHPDEFAQLFNTILINVTSFFRDAEAWDYLASEVVPALVEGGTSPVRVWTAGCASGEEAYSLAMILCEAFGREHFASRVKIYATDVDEDALATARQGAYTAKDVEAVPEALRARYFDAAGSRYVFRADLRRSIIFGRHDLVSDAPISKLDLLSCRNTLMYLNAETQARILSQFNFALNERGFLFLGKAEMLLTHGELFSPVNLKHRIFRKVPRTVGTDRVIPFPDEGRSMARELRLREASVEMSPLAQIVVTVDGDLALVNAQARMMFGLNMRDVGRPIQDLEISYRPIELRSLIDQAYTERRPVSVPGVERRPGDNDAQVLDVHVSPLVDVDRTLLGASVTFHDATTQHRMKKDLDRSRQDLESAYEELQSTNEELETTNEELQSTVEELETTNEELQSTNEELETMNEELQSTNAEMHAINDEMRERSDELDATNAFADHVLTTLDVAVAVLDADLRVRSWNRHAAGLWGVRTDEAVDVPLTSLEFGLPLDEVLDSINLCLRGDPGTHEVTVKATNRRGQTISCRVRCTALPRSDGMARAVVLLMEEVAG